MAVRSYWDSRTGFSFVMYLNFRLVHCKTIVFHLVILARVPYGVTRRRTR